MATKEVYILHSDRGHSSGFTLFSMKQRCLYSEMKISDPCPVAAEWFLNFDIYNSLKAVIWVKLDEGRHGLKHIFK